MELFCYVASNYLCIVILCSFKKFKSNKKQVRTKLKAPENFSRSSKDSTEHTLGNAVLQVINIFARNYLPVFPCSILTKMYYTYEYFWLDTWFNFENKK